MHFIPFSLSVLCARRTNSSILYHVISIYTFWPFTTDKDSNSTTTNWILNDFNARLKLIRWNPCFLYVLCICLWSRRPIVSKNRQTEKSHHFVTHSLSLFHTHVRTHSITHKRKNIFTLIICLFMLRNETFRQNINNYVITASSTENMEYE